MNQNCISLNNCPVLSLFNSLGKRWSIYILFHILISNKGFNELKKAMPKITSKVLSQRLLELEQEGFISKNILSNSPFRVEYSSTQKTKNLKKILEKLN